MTSHPTLVVVSGPPGSGKTTLAHEVARAVGCPAVCRDEIKEGMVHATPGFVPGPGDDLTMRALPAFFGVLELLLTAGVTTVAEAAFQGRIWRPRLAPLLPLARSMLARIVAVLAPADASMAGLVAWYSLIHVPDERSARSSPTSGGYSTPAGRCCPASTSVLSRS